MFEDPDDILDADLDDFEMEREVPELVWLVDRQRVETPSFYQ